MFFSCNCPRCELPRKRPRRWQRPVTALCIEEPRSGSVAAGTGGTEAATVPFYVLERLAHIRCAQLTLASPPGWPPIASARASVSGSVVTTECDLQCGSLFGGRRLVLRLDIGEPLGAPADGASIRTRDGVAHIRLALQPPPPVLLPSVSSGGAEAMRREEAGDGCLPEKQLLHEQREERLPREESGLCRRAAAQRRRERRELPGAEVHCRSCRARLLQLPPTVQAMPPTTPRPQDFSS